MRLASSPADIAIQTAKTRQSLQRRPQADLPGTLFKWLLISFTGFAIAFLGVLVVVMVNDGWSVLSGRLSGFLSNGFSQRSAQDAGVWQGIVGSVQIGIATALFAIPVGIATALSLIHI